MAKPDLRFAKVDFVDEAYGAYRASNFLIEELGYYNVGEGSHELVMPGVSKGAGARALLAELSAAVGAVPARVFAFGDSENDLPLFEALMLPWRWARPRPTCARPPTMSRSPVQTTASRRPWSTLA